jgi:hypothetical protein
MIRLHAVDLLPPGDTPFIGRHDPNWDPMLKHLPMQLRGIPPPIQQQQQARLVCFLNS